MDINTTPSAAEVTEQRRLQNAQEIAKERVSLKSNQLAAFSNKDLLAELFVRSFNEGEAGREVASSGDAIFDQQLKDAAAAAAMREEESASAENNNNNERREQDNDKDAAKRNKSKKTNRSDNINSLVQELEITSDRIANGEANTIVHDGEATRKEKEDALHRALVDLTMCFCTDGPPPGTYVMDPLSCIPFDPNSDWNITNNVSSGKDQWWSRLKYEFETQQHGLVRGDVLPIFGAHLDLHPRSTTSKLKNYGKNLVNVYLPTETVSYLYKAVKEKTGMNIAEGKEIVDMTQGLTSFLMGASKGVDTIPCKMYQAVLDEEDGQVVKYNIGKVPLNQLYKGANTDQNIRVMGGVAFVHLGVTFSCAPDEIPRAGQVPPGSLIDLKFKLVSFHCLSVTGRKINKITYKTATTQEY